MTFTDLDVEVIVAMKDCKGATTSVAFDLKYNEKTGAFSNSKAIALCNKTGMEILYYDVIAYKKGTSKREKLKKARRRQELYAEENY